MTLSRLADHAAPSERTSSVAATSERRRDRRAAAAGLPTLEVDGREEETFLFAYLTDLGLLGLFVAAAAPEPPGTRLLLRFAPGDGETLECIGEVLWINPPAPPDSDGPHQPGMGLELLDLEDDDRDRLLRLVGTFAYLDHSMHVAAD